MSSGAGGGGSIFGGMGGGLGQALLGTISKTVGGVMSVTKNNAALERNAKNYEKMAEHERMRGRFDVNLLQREHQQLVGTMQQGYANSGVAGGGSYIRNMSQQSGLNTRAQQVETYNHELAAYSLLRQADLARAQKGSAFSAGIQGLFSGLGAIANAAGEFGLSGAGSAGGCGSGAGAAFCGSAGAPPSTFSLETPAPSSQAYFGYQVEDNHRGFDPGCGLAPSVGSFSTGYPYQNYGQGFNR